MTAMTPNTTSKYTTRTYDLSNRTVAILATDGFEETELRSPLAALKSAGANVRVVSISDSRKNIRGWSNGCTIRVRWSASKAR